MVDAGFVKGSSDNLPYLDANMIDEFYRSKLPSQVELKHSKTQRSTRSSYGDNSIGYVQVKREQNLCTVKAKITPEHKVHHSNYQVLAVINEVEEAIIICECVSCAASSDHCKHAVAFLFWLHRRSEEPSVTDTICYWKKSTLSKVGADTQFDLHSLLKIEKEPLTGSSDNESFKNSLLRTCKDAYGGIFEICRPDQFKNLSIYLLGLNFAKNIEGQKDLTQFMSFIRARMTRTLCIKVESLTRDQSDSPLWYEMRYGRITASKLYECSRSSTSEGSLVESILGASAFKGSAATKRGLMLETEVLQVVSETRHIKINKCGLYINRLFPIFGASPDGITDFYVVEVKCPMKEKTMSNYIKNGQITPKYNAQLQLQMLFTRKRKGLFCVAHPNFETTKNVSIVKVIYDSDLCDTLLRKATVFWQNNIYPLLLK